MSGRNEELDDWCLQTAVTMTEVSPKDTIALPSAKRAYLPVDSLSGLLEI